MGTVRHIAFLKFKPGTSEEKAAEIIAELRKLPQTIPGVRETFGANNSRRG